MIAICLNDLKAIADFPCVEHQQTAAELPLTV